MANGKAGAPVGNRNGNKNKVWSDMLRLIVTQDKRKRMRAAAEALVSKAEEGDTAALKELGDRVEGRVPQAITGQEGGPIVHVIERVIVEKS